VEEGSVSVFPSGVIFDSATQRTTLKRKQLLQEIDPNLPKEHAPEIAALGHQSVILQGNRKDFALPYLNLEDLSVNNGAQCELSPESWCSERIDTRNSSLPPSLEGT
jgi:hypothetical protein